jgi:hypothetical protein
MKGDDYLNHFVLPNFYFHLTSAYAIPAMDLNCSESRPK